ncbi:MAG: class I SAM-dependent methyltransferase [bacterium]|nr:class I SAM-dependent methyltransferase [bacterium]
MPAQKLLELGSFQETRIFLSAVELEIFPLLQKPATSLQVATEKSLHPEFTERLMDALAAMKILHKEKNEYVIAREFHEFLGDGPNSLIGMLKHRAKLWHTWSSLTEIVRTGKTHYELHPEEEHHEEYIGDFLRAMAVSGRKIAEETITALDLEVFGGVGDVRAVLDIGGGPAIYAMEFCKELKLERMTILDRPGFIKTALEFIGDSPHKDQITFIEADALTVEDEKVIGPNGENAFDFIFTSNLIHSFSPDEVRELFNRMARWVTRDGQIVIKDFFLEDNRIHPQQAALFDINMMTGAKGGHAYAWSEVESWLRDAVDKNGEKIIREVERVYLSDGYSGMLVADVKE